MTERAIIVGTDGTGCGSAAVEWAAGEARRRGLPLRIVHAVDRDWHESRFDIGNEYIDVTRNLAEAVVTYADERARAIAPDLTVKADTLIGRAVPRLLEVSRGAGLLVLGTHGRGGFTRLLLGSVSEQMAARALCSVVVVRGRADPDGPIVAGVDDSTTADQVLEAAFEAAAIRRRPLQVLHSHLPPVPLWPTDIPPPAALRWSNWDAGERAMLANRVEPWLDKYPGVPVRIEFTHESAAVALVEASLSAQLVVVGGRYDSAINNALHGSPVPKVLHYANCPVLIVHPDIETEIAR